MSEFLKKYKHFLRLYKEALRQSATDPTTGRVDVSIIASGASDTLKKKTEGVAEVIRQRLGDKGTFEYKKLFNDLRAAHKVLILIGFMFKFSKLTEKCMMRL